MSKVVFTFSADDVEDRGICRELTALAKGERSRVIRAALAEYFGRSSVTLADVYERLAHIERLIAEGGGPRRRRPARASDDLPPEDPEAAAALDALGL